MIQSSLDLKIILEYFIPNAEIEIENEILTIKQNLNGNEDINQKIIQYLNISNFPFSIKIEVPISLSHTTTIKQLIKIYKNINKLLLQKKLHFLTNKLYDLNIISQIMNDKDINYEFFLNYL